MKYFIMAMIAITALACHKNRDQSTITEPDQKVSDNTQEMEEATDSASGAPMKEPPPSTAVLQAGSPDWDKKIIKTANLDLELKQYAGFNSIVHQSLKNYGAYIAQEQQLQSDGQISNRISIKVPVDQFENLLNYLAGADKDAKVLDKQITSEDVSAEVVDTRSRMETKKQLRAKYFELLKQAKKMDDILQVQEEINAITEDIEAAAGRSEFLSHQSAYSTINLKYYQVLDASKVDDASPGFITSFSNAFRRGGSLVVDLLLFFVNIWPLVIGGIAAWYLLKRRALKPRPQQVR